MARHTFIDISGRRTLHIDFTHQTVETEMFASIAEAGQMVAGEPLASLHMLTDVSGSHASEKIIVALKHLTRNNRPFVLGGAEVGLRPVQRLIYSAVMKFSGRNLSAFDTVEAAKDWIRRQ